MNQAWGEYEKGAQSDTEALIRHMIAVSGKSGAQLSRDLGRSSNFIWSTLQNGSTPRISLFVRIANLCGYDVEVRGNGEEYTLATENGSLIVLDGRNASKEALAALLEHVRENQRSEVLELTDEFCSGYDMDRLIRSSLAGFVKEPNGAYFLYDTKGNAIARCYYDTETGEPSTCFYD